MSFPSSNWMTFWLVGRAKTAGKSLVLGSTCTDEGAETRDGAAEPPGW